jgi:hypothetical protein
MLFWLGVPVILLFFFGATYETHDRVHSSKFWHPTYSNFSVIQLVVDDSLDTIKELSRPWAMSY